MKKNINSPYIEGGGICKKKICLECGCNFISEKNDNKCLCCLQNPQEEIDFINERKERMKMKKNGI